MARDRRPGGPKAGAAGLPKCPTGIRGLDEITEGGLPRGRPTLVCGPAGCGKSLLALEFIVRGARDLDEPGVYMSFEETEKELAQNVLSLGWDLKSLEKRRKLFLDYVRIDRAEIEETGEYSLEALFIRLGHAIDSVKARRVVLDSLEAVFGGFASETILRAEMRRLFGWLKARGITAVITAESGERTLTRHGIEEYVSDCVVLLDQRMADQIATRRLRVLKYRGTRHGTNEYPFLIEEDGISVLPITSLGLAYQATTERVSMGIERLDRMLGGRGVYRGTSVLVSGTAGTGKSSIAASFADAACRRGERCLYVAYEESADQILRNMRSIGIDLGQWVEKGLLTFHATRATASGLETHLVELRGLVGRVRPRNVIVDPVSPLLNAGAVQAVQQMLTRVIDHLKTNRITSLFTDLTHGGGALESSGVMISSLMDTWILLRDIEAGGERNRGLFVLKSRGMAHSNQVREFLITGRGIELLDVYTGPGGVLTGTARAAQTAREKAERLARAQELERQERTLARKRRSLELRIEALRAEFAAEQDEAEREIAEARLREDALNGDRRRMAGLRKADGSSGDRTPAGSRGNRKKGDRA